MSAIRLPLTSLLLICGLLMACSRAPQKLADPPPPQEPESTTVVTDTADAAEESEVAGGNDVAPAAPADPSAEPVSTQGGIAQAGAPTGDWAQWGGSAQRNNVPTAANIPHEWETGEFDLDTGEWDKSTSKNIKWVARVGSQTYGNPIIAGGKVFVGTNNGAGYIDRYPVKVDLGCLLCFRESDGEFLWQHSSEKLPSGRVQDWPLQGICCAPLVEGDRLWFVTSRGEVRCIDTEGFLDEENDGPVTSEEHTGPQEADVVWVYDMMKELKVSQHNMCSCSVTSAGDLLFVATSNGVDESHVNIPSPDAPSFLVMNKHTGQVLWTDKSPGTNILHGQWSSPAYGVLGGVPQVIFTGGDGWVYSFAPEGKDGQADLLWRLDANPKSSLWELNGNGTRNNIIATPVIYNGLVYVAVGQDPEHGTGIGRLWCIDPTKRGDVSAELAVHRDNLDQPIPHQRLIAVDAEEGEIAIPNPNSAVVWQYAQSDRDLNGDDQIDFEETMHRSCGTVAIKDDILYIADFSGLFHCLNAKTGEPNWSYDMFAAAWGSPLIVDGKVYIGDEDGDVAIFPHTADKEKALVYDSDSDEWKPALAEIKMGNSVYSTPVVANGILYIANKTHVFAIQGVSESLANKQ